MNYITYYQRNDKKYRIYNNLSQEYSTVDCLTYDTSYFYMAGKYEASDDELKRYADDLMKSSDMLTSFIISRFTKIFHPFNYITPFSLKSGKIAYRNHRDNITNFCKLFINKTVYRSLEVIDRHEYLWESLTNRGGLVYSVKGVYNSYGYDFSNFYASILASKSFRFPTQAGKMIYLDCIPEFKEIKYGYYKVIIQYTNSNVKKLLATSKNNVYTHFDLKQALKLKCVYDDITITLDTSSKYNALIYEKEQLALGYNVFNKWYQAILELKIQYPTNILTKMLSSSMWGHITRKNTLTVTEELGDTMNIGTSDSVDYYILDSFTTNKGEMLKLLNMKKPFLEQFRLTAFLTAYGRQKVANIVQQNIDDVIRVHTDGVCFSKMQSIDVPNFIPEAKTTGVLSFPINRKK